MTRLTVTFLGTSSATPTKGRALPSLAVQRDGQLILMDCGEGVQVTMAKMGVGLHRETTILITHLHGDHVTGLLGLLQTMSFSQRTLPLTLVAPSDLLRWIKATAKILHIGLTFDLRFVAARSGAVLYGKGFKILASRAQHTVEAYSYALEEYARPGTFYPEKALGLGIPEGKLWSRLQRGNDVVIKGRSVKPRDVMGPTRPGRKVGYSGDTRPTSDLIKFFRGCDLLIFDSTFSSKDRDKALERRHSTASEAALFAKKADAKQLILTHFSARYTNVGSLLREARKIFPNTLAAKDGLSVEVPYPSS